jgi:hypothetical protein
LCVSSHDVDHVEEVTGLVPYVQLFVPEGSAVGDGQPALVDAAAKVVARAYGLHPDQVLLQVLETAPGSSPTALAIIRTGQTLVAPAALDELSVLVCDSLGLGPSAVGVFVSGDRTPG